MSFAFNADRHVPYLRRFARALTGSQAVGDLYVRRTLESLIGSQTFVSITGDDRIDLYKIFHSTWRNAKLQLPASSEHSANVIEDHVQQNLSEVAPAHRVALLLTTLEEFDRDEAALIMDLHPEKIEALVNQAVADLSKTTKTDVLIIEDEPLITMQLDTLVTQMGHNVCGTPTTLTEAIECFREQKPGLILADIQLADGSSGIDAVKKILEATEVPVIFITAFPERLLTGERPEPTFLITKPFLENTVRAAIGQAIFLGSTALPMSI